MEIVHCNPGHIQHVGDILLGFYTPEATKFSVKFGNTTENYETLKNDFVPILVSLINLVYTNITINQPLYAVYYTFDNNDTRRYLFRNCVKFKGSTKYCVDGMIQSVYSGPFILLDCKYMS